MAFRARPPEKPVAITLDGERVVADDGEPIAASLLAAGKLSFARSPKFHRPRGPACLRAACDGCLARVDGVPNVMTCMHPAREGTRVEVQNTLGSRELDLLRVTDWFFPAGMDHHHLFAGVPGVQSVMQAFARRVAGLGQLPVKASSPRRAARREVDVVVVGAGAYGMRLALRLAERGRDVTVLDDGLSPGGNLRALEARDPLRRIHEAFMQRVGRGLDLRTSSAACGVYGDDLLVVGPDGGDILAARALVLATGAHDGVLPFEGNDMPGVASARAASMLASSGIVVGKKVLVVVSDGGGPFGDAFAAIVGALEVRSEVTVVHGDPVRVAGSSAVRSVTVRTAKGEETFKADALVVDAPRSPSYELPEQAGAALAHQPAGFVVRAPGGKVRGQEGGFGVWALGEVAGDAFRADAIEARSEDVARQVAAG